MLTSSLIQTENLSKIYHDRYIFEALNLHFESGKLSAIVGKSGSGKTTLLSILSGLEQPSSGKVFFEGQDIHQLSLKAYARLLNQSIGFVYQFHYLMAEFTLLENVMMPFLLKEQPAKNSKEKALYWIKQVELEHCCHQTPTSLSGGERARAAIARALVHEPKCIFLDEPTGNLDNQTSEHIQRLLKALNHAHGITGIVVTHDQEWAHSMDHVMTLQHGSIKSETLNQVTI